VLLTHGHPEHVEGTARHLADPARSASLVLVASAAVCRHLRRRGARPDDRFYASQPGDVIELPGLRIEVFGWRHMPLIPPEPKLALLHLARLLTPGGRSGSSTA
jgi:glyoxylase-like metal-dependent hydrolase (beta-lactamase superfamily II)